MSGVLAFQTFITSNVFNHSKLLIYTPLASFIIYKAYNVMSRGQKHSLLSVAHEVKNILSDINHWKYQGSLKLRPTGSTFHWWPY